LEENPGKARISGDLVFLGIAISLLFSGIPFYLCLLAIIASLLNIIVKILKPGSMKLRRIISVLYIILIILSIKPILSILLISF
jgi:hypothetical protein